MNGIDCKLGYFNKYCITSSLPRQFILFTIVGGICVLFDMAVLLALVEILKLNVIIANFISVLLASYGAYLLNVKYIFYNGKFGIRKKNISFLNFCCGKHIFE